VEKTLYSQRRRKIAETLRTFRKEAGMTQRDLAEKIGRPQNTVVRIEQGQRRVDFLEWISLCQACDVDPAQEGFELLKLLDTSNSQ
tara:strand:+ start:864 stop:1121 length:258 start_codon:yes stop_codon:yes gene_type:complete